MSRQLSQLPRYRAAAPLSKVGATLPFRRRVRFANLGQAASPLLTFGGLPTANFFQALGFLAVPLVPAVRLIDLTAPFAQAVSRPKPAASGGEGPRRVILEVSQGRCLLPTGAAREARTSLSGIFLAGRPRWTSIYHQQFTPAPI
jgi:hypothetical protein